MLNYYTPPENLNLKDKNTEVETLPNFKYSEDVIVKDFMNYLKSTYGEHYNTNKEMTCFDAWISLGDSTPTFKNTALKYMWRYGKKDGNNKKDLFKAMHYILMCLHVDHYDKEQK